MKNKKLALFLVSYVIAGVVLVSGISYHIVSHKNKEVKQYDKSVTQEPLNITVPEQNKMGTIKIITNDRNTGEEVTTELYGRIKVLNNGSNGEQQQYILYVE